MHPRCFLPVPNKWGEKGATLVRLAKVKPDILEGALRMAWTNKQAKTGQTTSSVQTAGVTFCRFPADYS